MNKLSKIFIIVLFIVVTSLIVMPYSLNKTAIKSQIERQISQKYGVNFKVNGNVGIKFLPLPQIALSDVVAENLITDNKYSSNIKISKLIIRLKIFSIFSDKTKIKGFIFENPMIESVDIIETNNISQASLQTIEANTSSESSNKIFNFQNSGQEIFDFKNIELIKFENGNFVKKTKKNAKEDQNIVKFSEINFLLANQSKKQKLTISGDFSSQNTPTTFNLVVNTKENQDSILTIQSSILNLVLSGKFTNLNVNNSLKSNFVGKLSANIINPKASLNKYFPKDNQLFLKINATQPLEINANINNQSGDIKVDNIVIKSQLLDGVGNVAADFNLQKPKINANFNFNNVDIDSIWFAGALNSDDNIIKSENEIVKKFVNSNQVSLADGGNKSIVLESTTDKTITNNNSVFDNLDLTATIKIKTAKYRSGNLQDVSFSFVTADDRKIFLQPLTATIEGGSLKVNGTLENDNNIPKFVGRIEVDGNDLSKSLSWLKLNLENLKPQTLSQYSFVANLLAMPDFVAFNNLNLSINNSKNIVTGNLILDDSSANSTSDVNLNISSLNYDDYFADNQKNSYLFGDALLNKFLWLKTVNSNYSINLSFGHLVYQDNNFDNQSLRIQFGQGYLKFSDINLSSPNLDIKGNVDIDIKSSTPTINLDIISNNFQLNSTRDNLGGQFFNLTSLEDFSGKIAIKIANFKLNDFQSNDVIILGDLRNGVVDFNNFDYKIYGGTAKYKGIIIFKIIKTINGSFELVGVDNKQFLPSILNINNISGASNVSAIINSSANNISEFFQNFNGKAQFISGNVVVDGFGLYDLAVKMAQPTVYKAELTNPDAILYASNSKSSFKDVGGAIEFQKGNNTTKFNIKASDIGINGVIYGDIDKEQIFNASANLIFISGTRQNPIPLSIATNFKGKSGAFEQKTNYSQIQQYLSQQSASTANNVQNP